MTLRRRGVSRADGSKPPAGAIAYASWVFLFKNFRHALWLGWPYLVFQLLQAGLVLLLFFYFMNHIFELGPKLGRFDPYGGFSLFFFNFVFPFIDAVLLCCLGIGWMRAIVHGVSHKNQCSFRDEWKLVLLCIAQLFGIYVCFSVFMVPFIMVSFFTLEGLSFEVAWFATAILMLFLVFMPLYFLGHAFMYFPAKANGHVLSSKFGWRLFKGLRFNFLISVVFAFLPLAAILILSIALLGSASTLLPQLDFKVNTPLIILASLILNFFMVLIFCGVLSGYYLWIRKHRMKSERPQTKVPDDPFSDEGWEGPMWEDVR